MYIYNNIRVDNNNKSKNIVSRYLCLKKSSDDKIKYQKNI